MCYRITRWYEMIMSTSQHHFAPAPGFPRPAGHDLVVQGRHHPHHRMQRRRGSPPPVHFWCKNLEWKSSRAGPEVGWPPAGWLSPGLLPGRHTPRKSKSFANGNVPKCKIYIASSHQVLTVPVRSPTVTTHGHHGNQATVSGHSKLLQRIFNSQAARAASSAAALPWRNWTAASRSCVKDDPGFTKASPRRRHHFVMSELSGPPKFGNQTGQWYAADSRSHQSPGTKFEIPSLISCWHPSCESEATKSIKGKTCWSPPIPNNHCKTFSASPVASESHSHAFPMAPWDVVRTAVVAKLIQNLKYLNLSCDQYANSRLRRNTIFTSKVRLRPNSPTILWCISGSFFGLVLGYCVVVTNTLPNDCSDCCSWTSCCGLCLACRYTEATPAQTAA